MKNLKTYEVFGLNNSVFDEDGYEEAKELFLKSLESLFSQNSGIPYDVYLIANNLLDYYEKVNDVELPRFRV